MYIKTGLQPVSGLVDRFTSRDGVIIGCPQNGLFQDLVNVILMSRTGDSELVDHDQDHERPLLIQYLLLKTLVNVFLISATELL